MVKRRVQSLGGGKYKNLDTGEVFTKYAEPEKEEEVRYGSRPAGVTLTPAQEFAAAEQERKIIREGGMKVKPKLQEEEIPVVEKGKEISAELGEKRLEQPSLEPEGLPFIKTREEAGEIQAQQREFIGKLLTGKATKEEIFTEAKNFATGAAISGGAMAIVAASPALASIMAGITAKSVFLTGALGTAVTAVSGYFGYKQVLDYKGGELDNMRGILSQYTEDGEKIQALVLQGADPITELEILFTYVDEINYAEATIKQIGNDNIMFRYEKEWIQDMGDIRTARTAVQRRIDAVLRIMQTGGVTTNPQELIYTVASIEK